MSEALCTHCKRVHHTWSECDEQDSQTDFDLFQTGVKNWVAACLAPGSGADTVERNYRFLEEALELVQSCGCTAEDAHSLVDYVFGRPVGETLQEVGGTMTTLAALCNAHDINLASAAFTELSRVQDPELMKRIRAKQDAKPIRSPLPGFVPPLMKKAGATRPWAFPAALPEPEAQEVDPTNPLTQEEFLKLAQERAHAQGLGTKFSVKSLFAKTEWEAQTRSLRIRVGVDFKNWVECRNVGIRMLPARAINNERQYERLL